MPRSTRDTPIATPIGMAVTHAAKNAVKTRNIDHPKCSASGASVSSPAADSYNRWNTTSGVGRNSGGSQRRWLASHHSATSATTVTALMSVVEPSPGVANRDVRAAACFAAAVPASAIGVGVNSLDAGALMRPLGISARCEHFRIGLPAIARRRPYGASLRAARPCGGLGRFAMLDHGKNFLAHADEVGRRLHRAGIARLDELAVESKPVL